MATVCGGSSVRAKEAASDLSERAEVARRCTLTSKCVEAMSGSPLTVALPIRVVPPTSRLRMRVWKSATVPEASSSTSEKSIFHSRSLGAK